MAPQLMWIGLGNMGRGMVKNLVQKGNLDRPLIIFNRTKKRCEDLAATLPSGKTVIADTIEEGVQKADIIFIIVANDAATKETLAKVFKADGGVKGKLIVNCSTISPDSTKEDAEEVLKHGAEFVACPVFGAPPAADAGQLIMVPAGPKSSIDKIRPYFNGVMGRAEVPFDDRPYETSLKLKIIGNTFIVNAVSILGEGMTLAEKTGVGAEHVATLVKTLLPGPVYGGYADRMTSGMYHKFDEPLFSADNVRKDAGYAISMAKSVGIDLKLTKVGDEYAKAVAEHAGGAKGDISAIYGAVRKASGLKYESDDK
ncbi:NAD binding domain of 6-phosphogluconate dehydrogenase-domain-containing protein [Xylariaceae sp. FL0255]|nr:NAD binding domain of 6-phosphogluconate dehydrogenase-domain-containing protein [Xylariaceae sp. FL0255]